jgi:hypothetical protein
VIVMLAFFTFNVSGDVVIIVIAVFIEVFFFFFFFPLTTMGHGDIQAQGG